MNTLNKEAILTEINILAAQAKETELGLETTEETLDGLKLTSEEAQNLIEKLESDIEDAMSDVETLGGEIEELEDTQREVARDVENLEGEKRDIESTQGDISHDLQEAQGEVVEAKHSLIAIKEKLETLERRLDENLTINKMLSAMDSAGMSREGENTENFLVVVEKEDYFIFIYDDEGNTNDKGRYWVNKFFKESGEFGMTCTFKNSLEECLAELVATI